jgi:hypothetical protein
MTMTDKKIEPSALYAYGDDWDDDWAERASSTRRSRPRPRRRCRSTRARPGTRGWRSQLSFGEEGRERFRRTVAEDVQERSSMVVLRE